VQCKLAQIIEGVLVVRLATCRYTPGGYLRSSYTSEEIDAVAAYSPELGSSYLIPIGDISGRTSVSLRLQPTRNHQARGVKWAEGYKLESVLRAFRAARSGGFSEAA
jgi:hypothetical protein